MQKVVWYLLLPLAFFAGDRLGGYLLQKQSERSHFRYSRLYQNKAKADILLLGNSRGLCLYQPYIEEITHKKTCNLSYNGLPMDAAKALVLDYLDRYPEVKTLVIDVTMCDRENDPLLTGFLAYTDKSERLNTLIHNKELKAWWGGQVSHLFRYNNEIFQRALYYRNKSDEDWLLDRVITEAQIIDTSKSTYELDVNPYLIRQLQETIEASLEKGVQAHLVIAPYLPGFTVENLDNLKKAVEKATGLQVLDYRNSLVDPTFFGDYMHLNKEGSRHFIDMLRKDGVFD
ncbi:MAG: hypothetical protein H6576_05730 [Lewinellaceae bacterium]|nr:hypothetical protein [Saprospiraceae bacterium]MCB9343173.1 hypothetical protein [Lewinellaceae bacterium]